MYLVYLKHSDGRDGYLKEPPATAKVFFLTSSRYEAYIWTTREEANDARTNALIRSPPGWCGDVMPYYDSPVILGEKPVAKPICVCHKCGEQNEYAEPNQPDGRYVCVSCRRYQRAW